MKSIDFLIVGCGRIAERHAEHISKYGHLIAVCDVIPEKAKDLSSRYECAYYSRIETMLKCHPNSDVVSICTPNGLHAHHTILALEAGKHVVCEKPMAINSADCDKMIAVARDAKKCLFIVKQNRFNPPIVALKRAIIEGRLGRIVNVQLNCFWNRNNDYYLSSDWKGKLLMDGGTLFTQFSHFIDGHNRFRYFS